MSALEWEQGQHVTLIGPTGGGKTSLARRLLKHRRYVLVLATKPKDPVVTLFKKDGFRVIRTWPPPPPDIAPKIVYWPRIEKMGDEASQQAAILRVLHETYRVGGWTLYFDEIRYVTQTLKLDRQVSQLLLQGRSLGLSIVGATQRPYHIPLECYDQASHLFLWRDTDKRNLERLSDISGVDGQEIAAVVVRLRKHEVCYVNAIEGTYSIIPPSAYS